MSSGNSSVWVVLKTITATMIINTRMMPPIAKAVLWFLIKLRISRPIQIQMKIAKTAMHPRQPSPSSFLLERRRLLRRGFVAPSIAAKIKAIMIAVDATIDEELVDDYIPYLADFIASDVSNDESYFSSPIFSSTPSIDNCRTFTLTIKEAIAEIADLLHVDAEAFDILFPVFLSETKNRLQPLLGKGDYALPGNEFNIILLFSQGKSIDADLLQFQLQKNLFSLFGNSTPKILVESVQS